MFLLIWAFNTMRDQAYRSYFTYIFKCSDFLLIHNLHFQHHYFWNFISAYLIAEFIIQILLSRNSNTEKLITAHRVCVRGYCCYFIIYFTLLYFSFSTYYLNAKISCLMHFLNISEIYYWFFVKISYLKYCKTTKSVNT